MKLSYRWLGRHVDLAGIGAEELAADLTLRTAEVEGVERFAPVLADVKVGEVLARERHPDADRLSVCSVDVGAGAPLSIVCGAANVRAGLKVAVATVGTRLPGGVEIKKAKIRGVESQGMICSERELGLGDEHAGIWELSSAARVGLPVDEALGLADWVIEIDNKSLTHRPDLWGHRGIAGEIAAIRGLALAPLALSLPATGGGAGCPVSIESAACARYLALPIEGVRAVRSPDWLRALLLAVGQRPLDLLVDVSNFVMLDLGQPNHLFDRRRIGPRGIVVRDARPGEQLVTLDGVERRLEPTDLLICAGDEPVALAGIMGGAGAKVEGDTDSLLLEVAAFDPVAVRRTSARLGLRTEASARFEKHLDPTLPLAAAAHLVRTLAAIQPELRLPAPLTDAGRWSDPARVVSLRPTRVREVLGVAVADDEIALVLGRLGFDVDRGGPAWSVGVPSARATKDVRIEEDLIEEVGRIYRYDRIPERALAGELLPPPQDPRRHFVRRVQDRLAGAACFREALTHSYQHDRLLERLGLLALPYVEVRNPVAEGLTRIRRSVAPSLLATLADNLRARGEVRLFEVGRGYRPEEPDKDGVPREVRELALVWSSVESAAGFHRGVLPRLKGVVDDLVQHVERGALAWRAARAEELPPWADRQRSAAADLGPTGAVGAEPALLVLLDRRHARELELPGETAVAVLDLDRLIAAEARPLRYAPLARFPGTKLDVALAVDQGLAAAEVRAAIERAGKGLVRQAELFDLYAGEQVGAGRKSLAWHVLLAAPDRTLSDEDQQRFLDRLEREIGRLGGILRRE